MRPEEFVLNQNEALLISLQFLTTKRINMFQLRISLKNQKKNSTT
jgi:hypothetical protein